MKGFANRLKDQKPAAVLALKSFLPLVKKGEKKNPLFK